MTKKYFNIPKDEKQKRIYIIWQAMKNRCRNKKSNRYKDWGGRGIKVCDEWKDNFLNFYKWAIDNKFNDCKNRQCQLDRIDNNGDYEPNNCRFVTAKSNSRNKRSNHLIAYNNETHCLSEWEEILNLPIKQRIYKGWSVEKAFTTPRMKNQYI